MCNSEPKVVYIHPHGKPVIVGWLKPKQARQYEGGVDVRTWRKWKNAGLRTITEGGLELTKPEWIDSFLLRQEKELRAQVKGFLSKKKATAT